jgi:hypothetical protein
MFSVLAYGNGNSTNHFEVSRAQRLMINHPALLTNPQNVESEWSSALWNN